MRAMLQLVRRHLVWRPATATPCKGGIHATLWLVGAAPTHAVGVVGYGQVPEHLRLGVVERVSPETSGRGLSHHAGARAARILRVFS